jgi:hypothetical protein
MAVSYLAPIYLWQDCEFLLLARPSWINCVSSVERISGKTCSRGHSFYILADDLLRLAVKWVVLVETEGVRKHHGAKFFIHLSVHHQSSWKICVSMYLMPEHQLLHTHVLHIVHSLKSHVDFCAHFRMLRDGVFCDMGNFAIIQPQMA